MNLLNKAACGCGDSDCNRFGLVRYRRGERICNKECVGQCCINGRNKKVGTKRQREAAKAIGQRVYGLGAGNEENWTACWRTEVKADRQAQSVEVFFRRTYLQSDEGRAFGDIRPFVPIANVNGRLFAVIPLDEMDNAVEAWVNR